MKSGSFSAARPVDGFYGWFPLCSPITHRVFVSMYLHTLLYFVYTPNVLYVSALGRLSDCVVSTILRFFVLYSARGVERSPVSVDYQYTTALRTCFYIFLCNPSLSSAQSVPGWIGNLSHRWCGRITDAYAFRARYAKEWCRSCVSHRARAFCVPFHVWTLLKLRLKLVRCRHALISCCALRTHRILSCFFCVFHVFIRTPRYHANF